MHPVSTERVRLLVQIERITEKPLLFLSFGWVVLVLVELIRGLSPAGQRLNLVIWGIFIVQFVLEFIVAPSKVRYLKRNWITLLSLVLPAFRLLRVAKAFRFVRVGRGLRLASFLGSTNRGIRAVRRSMSRHGFGYVVALTFFVMFAGAAGVYAFEREGPAHSSFDTYWSSLYWSAMMITTLGSEAWPKTGAGRALALLIAIYAFTVFGYITATLASMLIETDRKKEKAQVGGQGQGPETRG